MSAVAAVVLLALVGVAAWLAAHVWPPTEATRLRNSLLFDVGDIGDFCWDPATVPADFRAEVRMPDPYFAAVITRTGWARHSDWERARAIVAHLVEHARERGPIRSDPQSTYRGIREGYGYCADYVKAFIVLAQAAGLAVRQWAFSFDGFGGHGHTFVEIWDRGRGKWVFVDVHNNVHAVDAVTGEPLSALEFRAYLRGGGGSVRIEPVGPGREGYEDRGKLLAYWRRGAGEWYLWWGNAVQSYYAHPIVRVLGRLSAGLAHAAGIALQLHPRMRALREPDNTEQIARMLRLGRNLRTAIAAIGLLIVALFFAIASPTSR